MTNAPDSGGHKIADNLMAAVEKSLFFDGMPLPVSIFLRLKSTRYLLVGKAGGTAQLSNLHAFQNADVKIFVRTTDYGNLISFLESMTAKLIQQKSFPDALKVQILSGMAEKAMSSFEGKDLISVSQLQKVSGLAIDLVKNVSAFSEIAKILMGFPPSDNQHAMATCFITLLLMEEMNMNHRPALEKAALGALLHDFGLRYIPKDITSRPRHQWSQDELKIYEQHPIKGVEMLRDLKDISNDVLLIIAEHHENALGTGFPKKLRDIKISPLSRVVSVADCCADLMFSTQDDSKNFTAQEALVYIEDILGQPFNKQTFSAFKNIVNKTYLKSKIPA